MPAIDLATVAVLGDPGTGRGRAALIEIFRIYFDNVSAACADMRLAPSADTVRSLAHRSKGASGVVGAVALTALFADVESRAAAGETIDSAVFDEIERQLRTARNIVAAEIGEELE